MTYWTNPHHAGLLPQVFLEDDPRTAQEQANDRYAHGGGWSSFQGFELKGNPNEGIFTLNYPGDPPLHELSRTTFHNQLLVLFEHSWVALIDLDGNLVDVSRMD